jgi:hypothetical protein
MRDDTVSGLQTGYRKLEIIDIKHFIKHVCSMKKARD